MAGHADVVIGSAYGDEGKGLVTDILAARRPQDTLVVRFNGGAQAGHTVVTPQGQRHVFSHVGSGAFSGATTFLSRFFVVNPLLLQPELRRLAQLGVTPGLLADPRAMVTTPFDMMVNTALERRRGAARHGSCGVGFGETVGRHEEGGPALLVADLAAAGLRQRLRAIRDQWLPRRLAALDLTLPEEECDSVLSEALLSRFEEDVADFLTVCTVRDEQVIREASHVVLEGAQGLLLDQDMGAFPHVTRSNTGLRNAAALLGAAGIGRLTVHYVLRPYITRHGAGPLPGELAGLPYPNVCDQTNLPNPWQGTLRFAPLDLDVLARTLDRDAQHGQLPAGMQVSRQLAVTCLDQVDGEVRFLANGESQRATPADFVRRCLAATSSTQALTSYGPTRDTCGVMTHALLRRSRAASAGRGATRRGNGEHAF